MAGIDSNVSGMLHCDGSDASTTFTGSELTPKTWTAQGNAQIDTGQSKFGGASGLFDGSGDWVDTPAVAGFDLGTGDGAIDFWLRFNSVAECGIVSNGATASAGGLSFNYDGASLVFRIASTEVTKTWSPSANTWYHVEYDRSGTTGYFFIDGTLLVSSFTALDVPSSSNTMKVGSGFRNSAGLFTTQIYLNGWVDEFRFTKGVARHTANFTAPSSAYSANRNISRMMLMGTS